DAVAGMRTFLTNPPLVRIGGNNSRSLYQFTLQSSDLPALYGSTSEFEKRMRTLPGLSDVNSDLQITSPMLNVDIDRDRALSLGDAVERVQDLAREVLPDSVSTSFQGAAAAFQSSLEGMGLLLALAILVIYMVLGILYESFIHPLTILSGLPSAGLGALATLLIFHDELNIYSFVGVIMLIGIVKKNAIMMIDFALESQRTQGTLPADAIYEACLIRFR